MPNIIAYAAIWSWPLFVIFFIKRYGIERGILLGLLGAYLFLPARFSIDLPGIYLDKFTVTTLVLTLFILLSGKKIGFVALSSRMKFLLFLFLIAPFLTVLTNMEPYRFLPRLTLYDGFVDSVITFLNFVPFLMGVHYFKSFENQVLLFKIFALAALFYALLALFEIRMSPQLHTTLYGYFPHSWIQQYRSGGFRAIVFMGHGLLVAFFLAIGLACLTAMNKINVRVLRRIDIKILLIFMITTAVLMKSLAALIFGIFMLLMFTFSPPRLISLAALFIAIVFVSYPITSAMKIFPHEDVSNLAGMISLDRQGSLLYRFENETRLLEHASQKPLFGWGGWGRNRVFDAETGEDITVTDGKWIITLGTRGWVGFLSEFLFFIVPIWLAYKLRGNQKVPKNERFLLVAHSLIVAIILLDQMPNASMNALYWLVVGALLGRAYDINKQLKGSTQTVNIPKANQIKTMQ